MNSLSCEVRPRLDVLSAEEWECFFPGLPDSLEMIRLVQDVGLDGFGFHSILVRNAGKPLLLLPLFETRYALSTFVDGAARPAVDAVARWLPQLLAPRILGVGFVEGEWSQVGMDASAPPALLEEAWGQALEALKALAFGLRADLTAFVHFTTASGRWLPLRKLGGYSELVGLPYAQARMVYSSVEEYIGTLSAKMRADLRRKLRKSQDVKVIQTRDPAPWLDTIYQYYLETVANSDVVFGVHRRAYFERVCREVPGTEYWLYFAGGCLLAFKLVVVKPDCVVDKYFGMDHELGKQHNVYFVAWVELIRSCIERGIPLYHASQAEEDTKSRLGAQFIPSLILFKHRQSFMHRLLALLSRYLSYTPKVALLKAQLGAAWKSPSSAGTRRQEPLPGLISETA